VVQLGIVGIGDAVLIGAGGSAVVFAARTDGGEAVAVKLLRISAADDRSRKQFEREAAAIERLSAHESIVPILGSGTSDRGEPYLLMPLMAGSAQQAVDEHGPLGWQKAMELLLVMCDAIDFAHSKDVIHRDIKPANILLDSEGRPFVADFGIAKLVDGTQTLSSQVAATPSFAPPERFRGEQATKQSDVYSLAATYVALVTGKPPFSGPETETPEAVMRRVLDEPPPDLTTTGIDIPPALAHEISAAMSKRPDDRPATARVFADALSRAAQPDAFATTGQFTMVLPSNVTTMLLSPLGEAPSETPSQTHVATEVLQPGRSEKVKTERRTSAVLALLAVFIIAAVSWNAIRDGGDAPETGETATAVAIAQTEASAAEVPQTVEPIETVDVTPKPATVPPGVTVSATSDGPAAAEVATIALGNGAIGELPLASPFSDVVVYLEQQLGPIFEQTAEEVTWRRDAATFIVTSSDAGNVERWEWNERNSGGNDWLTGDGSLETPSFPLSLPETGFEISDGSITAREIFFRYQVQTGPSRYCFYASRICMWTSGDDDGYSATNFAGAPPAGLALARPRSGMIEFSLGAGAGPYFHHSGEVMVVSAVVDGKYEVLSRNGGTIGVVGANDLVFIQTGFDPGSQWTPSRGFYVSTETIDLRQSPDGLSLDQFGPGTHVEVVGEPVDVGTTAWIPVRTEFRGSWGKFTEDRYPIGVGWLRTSSIEPHGTMLYTPTVDVLNLRDTPNGAVIAELDSSDLLKRPAGISNGGSLSPDVTWTQVETSNGTTGWVARDLIAPTGSQ